MLKEIMCVVIKERERESTFFSLPNPIDSRSRTKTDANMTSLKYHFDRKNDNLSF